MQNTISELGRIVDRLNSLKDDTEQLQYNNKKLNEGIQVLEKEQILTA